MSVEFSVVIPAYNEADNLPELVREIRAAMPVDTRFEIICVDDGSTDDTADRLAEAASRAPDLRHVRHEASCGQSTAVWTGVMRAEAPLVLTLDGDGQNDPADIPAMIDAFRSGSGPADNEPVLVIGHRQRRHDSRMRRLSSRIANAVRQRMLGDQAPDSGCGLKLFRREDYLRLPYFDHMHRFLPPLFARIGGRVVSVPVNHRARMRGQSKYGIGNRLWVGIVDLFGVWWLMRRNRMPGQVREMRFEDQSRGSSS